MQLLHNIVLLQGHPKILADGQIDVVVRPQGVRQHLAVGMNGRVDVFGPGGTAACRDKRVQRGRQSAVGQGGPDRFCGWLGMHGCALSDAGWSEWQNANTGCRTVLAWLARTVPSALFGNGRSMVKKPTDDETLQQAAALEAASPDKAGALYADILRRDRGNRSGERRVGKECGRGR